MLVKPDALRKGASSLRVPKIGKFRRYLSELFDNSAKASASDPVVQILRLSRQLLEGNGISSKLVMAREIGRLYEALDLTGKNAFFMDLATTFGPDWASARTAWDQHEGRPSPSTFRTLMSALEPPRQELFRRINGAVGGTGTIVRMRADLLRAKRTNAALDVVDDDLSHLLQSWFNIGFLTMKAIDWSASADVLERVMRYEAVHAIVDWSELRRRLLPSDRRCYAFFHPAMPDEPLIFVEIALTMGIPDSIQGLLAETREIVDAETATTAVFYSISNCQEGLHGISFGDLLIKAVVTALSCELPNVQTFVTLSPIPGFRKWLSTVDDSTWEQLALTDGDLDGGAGKADSVREATLRKLLMPLAARYLLHTRDSKDRPLDPVARFHLGNGACIERLCWRGDTSSKGIAESAGIMVNYKYDLAHVPDDRAAFASSTSVRSSRQVRQLARGNI